MNQQYLFKANFFWIFFLTLTAIQANTIDVELTADINCASNTLCVPVSLKTTNGTFEIGQCS